MVVNLNEKPEIQVALRDYFAAAALNGILSNHLTNPAMAAVYAYKMADDMLKQRLKLTTDDTR